jgi:small subunit ribosomal protein S16
MRHHLQVAINSSKRRDAKPLEKLGEYDPIPRLPGTSPFMSHHSSGPSSSSGVISPAASALAHGLKKEKRIEWDVERIRHWLDVGAEPTETVVKLLERVSWNGVSRTGQKVAHPERNLCVVGIRVVS